MSIMSFDWDEGCQTETEKEKTDRLHWTVSHRKAFINKCGARVCKHLKKEVICSGLLLCLMHYVRSWNSFGTFLRLFVQITCILSSPCNFITALFWKEHLIHRRSHNSWERKDTAIMWHCCLVTLLLLTESLDFSIRFFLSLICTFKIYTHLLAEIENSLDKINRPRCKLKKVFFLYNCTKWSAKTWSTSWVRCLSKCSEERRYRSVPVLSSAGSSRMYHHKKAAATNKVPHQPKTQAGLQRLVVLGRPRGPATMPLAKHGPDQVQANCVCVFYRVDYPLGRPDGRSPGKKSN